MSYRAFVVNKTDDDFTAALTELDEAHLPEGDVTVAVEWSSVNYKDGLACIPNGRVVQSYPMTPGIDLAGTVTASADSRFNEGDHVLATGWGLGVSHPGGFAEIARLPGDWLVSRPNNLSAEEAMAFGTAGFTAALSIHALEHAGLKPADGPVIVTGATGGVGSTAVAMLAGLGYTVAASTGKSGEHDYLRSLGAGEILSREDVSAESKRPLETERWAAAVDPVGAATTAYLLRTTKYRGSIALSGLTGGMDLPTSVLPFILRGVNLLGIDSVQCPQPLRNAIWQRLASDLKPAALLDSIAVRTDLGGIADVTARILRGEVRGRTLVALA